KNEKYQKSSRALEAFLTKYLENLRQYKTDAEHEKVYAWFDNSGKNPVSRAQHLVDLPDSLDVVSLLCPDNLLDWEIREMAEIRMKKDTKVIYDISFDSIKVAYNRQQGSLLNVEPVSERFEDFLMDSLLNALKIMQKYNYDGICVSYTGRKSTHMTEEERNEYIMNESLFTGIIKDWHIRNSGKLLSFKGKPQNLYFKTFLKECDIIWVLGTQVTNKDMLTYEYSLATAEGVDDIPVGMIVSMPSLDTSDKITGYLGSVLAVDVVAEWAILPQGGKQVGGVGIHNVSNDYFYADKNYKYTKKIISSLNPSVK
uniref:glycoside hydrolase family 18 n=1 Tax=Bacteroides finegoldii TaxID=338188 RepID=UPI0035662505